MLGDVIRVFCGDYGCSRTTQTDIVQYSYVDLVMANYSAYCILLRMVSWDLYSRRFITCYFVLIKHNVIFVRSYSKCFSGENNRRRIFDAFLIILS